MSDHDDDDNWADIENHELVDTFLHPLELDDKDWLEVRKIARKLHYEGHFDWFKAGVLAYWEWLDGMDVEKLN